MDRLENPMNVATLSASIAVELGAHIKKYNCQMMAMLLLGVAAFCGSATIGVAVNDGNATERVQFSWI